MKKLKLETLEVTSFETSPALAGARGTVEANSHGGTVIPVNKTYDIKKCGDTNYLDCTLVCSLNTACPYGCTEA